MPIVNGQFEPDWHESDLRLHYQLAQSHGWLPHFKEGAQQFGFKTEELLAIGSRETGFLWKRHPDGAILGDGGHGHGIMQIDDRSHRDFTSSPDWKIPRANILKGAEILAQGKRSLTSDAGDETVSDELVYAAYNAGVAGALKGLRETGDPSRFTTGHDYGKDVLARAAVFAKLLAQPSPVAPQPQRG